MQQASPNQTPLPPNADGYSSVKFKFVQGISHAMTKQESFARYNKGRGLIDQTDGAGDAPGGKTPNPRQRITTVEQLLSSIPPIDGVYIGNRIASAFLLRRQGESELMHSKDALVVGQVYNIVYNSDSDEMLEHVTDWLKNHSGKQFEVIDPAVIAGETNSLLGELLVKNRHMKLGGSASPRPLESLYMYTVNSHKTISTIRTGGATYLPAGQAVTAYEVGVTFIGHEEINTILRRWIASIYHSPILEIVQEDIRLLGSHPTPFNITSAQRTKKNVDRSNLEKVFKEIKTLIQNSTVMTSIQKMLTNGFGGPSEQSAIKATANVMGELRRVFGEAKNAADITTTHRIRDVQELIPVMNSYLPTEAITDLLGELVGSAINIFDLFQDVTEIEAAIRADAEKEDQELEEPIEYIERLMVACQNFEITTLPDNPLALHFTATFMHINHKNIVPRFSYKSPNGRKVDTVEESAFFDWVSGSLKDESGLVSGVSFTQDVPEFHFSRYTSPEIKAGDSPINERSLSAAISRLFVPTVSDVDVGDDATYNDAVVYNDNNTIINLNSAHTSTRGVQLRASFDFTPVQIESDSIPMYQYLGLNTVDVVLDVVTKNRNMVKKATSLIDNLVVLARNKYARKPYLVIENDVLNMADFRACLPQSVQVSPDPETIDTWNVSIQLVKYSSRDIKALQGGLKQVNAITEEDYNRAFSLIFSTDISALHQDAINTLFSSIMANEVMSWKDNVAGFMQNVNTTPLGEMSEDLLLAPGVEGIKTTKHDLQTFWVRTGLWMGPPVSAGIVTGFTNVNTTADCYEAAFTHIGAFSNVSTRFKPVVVDVPIKELASEDPGVSIAGLLNRLGEHIFSDEAQRNIDRIHAGVEPYDHVIKDRTLPIAGNVVGSSRYRVARSSATVGDEVIDGDTLKRVEYNQTRVSAIPPELQNKPYNNIKVMQHVHRDQATAFYEDRVKEEFGVTGFAWKMSVSNEVLGYYEMIERTLFRDLIGLANGRLALLASSRRDKGAVIQANGTNSMAANDNINSNATAAELFDDPIRITDQILYCIPRLELILKHFILNNFEADQFSTDPIFGDNVNTYPDLRIPRYRDYASLLDSQDLAKGKGTDSFMSPDWYYDYSEYQSAVEGMYRSFSAKINTNVKFNKQLLANRYANHIGETESTELIVEFPAGMISKEALDSTTYPYFPVPASAMNSALADLDNKAARFMNEPYMHVRVRGLWSNRKDVGLREIAKLENRIDNFGPLEEGSDLSLRVEEIRAEVSDKKKRYEQLGDTGGSEYEHTLWRKVCWELIFNKLKSQENISISIPLASLSYLEDQSSFTNLAGNQEELRQRMVAMDEDGYISFEPESDPLYNPYTEEELDAHVGGSFLSQAYGNSSLMNDPEDPHLNDAFFQEDKLGSSETLNSHREILHRESELNDEMGFKTLYPTYYVLFYEEDASGVSIVHDFYKAAGVTSIQIHHDAKNPISIASIGITNPFDALFSKFVDQQADGSNKFGTRPPLKVGMGVQIKLGYDANSGTLETVFTGQITDIRYGLEVEILCQSWGIELTYQNGTQGFFDASVHATIGPEHGLLFKAGVYGGSTLGFHFLGNRVLPWASSKVFTAARISRAKKKVPLLKGAIKALKASKVAKGAGNLFKVGGGIASLGASVIAGAIVGKGIDAVFDGIALAAHGIDSPNAPYRLLDKTTHSIEQHLAVQIFSDWRIRHFNTPLYLGTEHQSPKTQNIYFPTTPELWENTADLIINAAALKRAEVNFQKTYKTAEFENATSLLKDRLQVRNTALKGREFDFLFKNMTAWEALGEFTRRYPHLTMATRPFDFRSTVFIGRPDRLYRYTERRDQNWKDWVESNRGGRGESSVTRIRTLINQTKDDFFLDVVGFLLNQDVNWMVMPPDISNVDRRTYLREDARTLLNRFDLNASGFDNVREFIKIPYVGDTGYAIDWVFGKIARGFTLPKGNYKGMTERLQLIHRYIDKRQAEPGTEITGKWIIDENLLPVTLSGFGFASKVFGTEDLQNVAGHVTLLLDMVYESWLATQKMSTLLNNQLANHPHMRPFRRYHLAVSTSVQKNIVSNQISASDNEVYNQVNMGVMNEFTDVGPSGTETPSNWSYIEVVADPTIERHNRKIAHLQCRTTSDPATASQIAISALKSFLGNMYTGQLIQLGNPYAFPQDRLILADDYNEMAGAVDVNSVSHVFNRTEGFVTSYEPMAIVYTKDYLGPLDFVNQKANKVAEFWSTTFAAGALGSFAFMRNPLGKAVGSAMTLFSLEALSNISQVNHMNEIHALFTGRSLKVETAPLIIAPLIQRDDVMLAGVNGFRWDTTSETVGDNSLLRRLDDYLKVGGTGISEFWQDRKGLHLNNFYNTNLQEIRLRQRRHDRLRFRAAGPRENFLRLWGGGDGGV